jgi:hypothetical protein
MPIELTPLPPKEAVEYFRQKGYQVGFDYRDVWQEEHQAAFTVAKAMNLDILKDIRGEVDKAIADGVPFEQFRKNLTPILQQKGWWGVQPMQDPLTGEVKAVQLGSPRRIKTIYDTNLRTAHTEGQWQRIQDSKDTFPYLMYSGGHSAHPRHLHLSWTGMVLPVDDPFWQAHLPIKDWGCKCRVIPQTEGMLSRAGRKISAAPVVPDYTYINKRTGEVQQIPDGVDPAFHYPPGKRLATLPKFITDKVISAPADLGAAFWSENTALRPGIKEDFAAWASQVGQQGVARNTWQVAGFMALADVRFLADKGRAVQSAEIAIPDKLIVGRKAIRHQMDGDALTPEEWAALPDSLDQALQAVLYDTETGNLLYVSASQTDPRKIKVVVQPDFVTRKPKTLVNMTRSAFKLPVDDLLGGVKGGKYIVVRGQLK